MYVCYKHRTARGHEHGTALTFLTPDEEVLLDKLEEWFAKATASSTSSSSSCSVAGSGLKPYHFRMSEVEGFRYRVKVTSVCVHVSSACICGSHR